MPNDPLRCMTDRPMAVNAGKSLASLGGHGDFAARFLLALRVLLSPR